VNLKNKKVLVVGLGRTGLAVARFLKKMQASVVVSDTADENAIAAQVQIIKDMGFETELGQHRTETFKNADMIVVSPGVSHTMAPIAVARQHGVPILGEIELAARFIQQPIVAVTGTNGKTTTTELIGAMLRKSGRKVFVGGNIGNPLIDYVEMGAPAEVVIAEISSFQLDTISSFHPQVSVLLNISADHLDRYPNLEAYAASKARIFENQRAEDIAVLNGSDAWIRSHANRLRCRKLFYPDPQQNEDGALLKDGYIFVKLAQGDTRIEGSLDTKATSLRGQHNRENACAAALAALVCGADLDGIQSALENYRGSADRLEYVDTVDQVEYFNDSKATNVAAVARALESFSEPVLLIMGGRDKGSDFRILEDNVHQQVKMLILIGEAAETIESMLSAAATTIKSASMQEAVNTARRASEPGDIVLLSPGCASFDMYDNYTQRGDAFRRAVKALK
jgi:UDP-N-acetylmuramoylalanine--D-glutamate ligase